MTNETNPTILDKLAVEVLLAAREAIHTWRDDAATLELLRDLMRSAAAAPTPAPPSPAPVSTMPAPCVPRRAAGADGFGPLAMAA